MKSNEQQVGGNHYKSAEDKGLPQHWDVAIGMGWSYCIGAATKYIWRLDKKGGPDKAIQDLKKAIHYLTKELEVREADFARMQEDLKEAEDYMSRFHGCSDGPIVVPPPYKLSDIIRKQIRDEGQDGWCRDGFEDSGDANSRYTNQG